MKVWVAMIVDGEDYYLLNIFSEAELAIAACEKHHGDGKLEWPFRGDFAVVGTGENYCYDIQARIMDADSSG